MRIIEQVRERLEGSGEPGLLLQAMWGLEKESQRIDPSGRLALTPHPAALGDKLTHPCITTDFAESQLELITPPFSGTGEVLEALAAIQDEADAGLGNELLWPLSMPPVLPEEDDIPIARYGNTPEGKAREAYREGLAARYGKKMQMICGLHVNFSYGADLLAWLGEWRYPGLPREERKDALYFDAARNFLRHRWLLIYLFGASPVADPTYDSVIQREFRKIVAHCPACSDIAAGRHDLHATSLRVSRFGYANESGRTDTVSFNSREAYVSSYRRLLSSGELGTESEWYSPIRLKSDAPKGESQLAAMERSGVKYMEVRLLDLNPYERLGIDRMQLDFLHLFMLFCLLADSPPIDDADFAIMQDNHHLVSLLGRQPGLKLRREDGQSVPLAVWAEQLLEMIGGLADLVGRDAGRYREAAARERAKLADPSLVPSAAIMREMAERGETFAEFGLRLARKHKKIPLAEGTK